MLRLVDKLANHGLDDADVAVEDTTEGSSNKGDPEVGGKADNEEGKEGASAAQKEDWLSADAVAQTSPVHAGEGLGKSKGRDEDAGVKGSIFLVGAAIVEDELPSVWEDGGEGNRLSNSDES